MSALLQGVPPRVNGKILVADGIAPPNHFANGIPYGSLGALAIDFTSGVDHWYQGMPFTSEGRIAAVSAVPVRFNSGAMPLDADGKLCIFVDGLTNLYPNPEFAGGNPPTNHIIPFLTNGSSVVEDPNKAGFFQYFSNTNDVSGRSALQLDVNANTALTVGNTYRIQYRVQNLNDQNYSVALITTGESNVTIENSFTRSAPGSTSILFIEFTPTDPSYTLNVRVGCGTTANNTVQLRVDQPVLVDITAGASTEIDAYSNGVGYNAAGALVGFTSAVFVLTPWSSGFSSAFGVG